ncbi:hypothetical protein [Streptomyces sp. NPDC017940]|uniref:hypothetical protein n=1 Tax=Streptomyces sp. NPDC017940 TaxID=3365017 RepID=UPI0037B3FCE5
MHRTRRPPPAALGPRQDQHLAGQGDRPTTTTDDSAALAAHLLHHLDTAATVPCGPHADLAAIALGEMADHLDALADGAAADPAPSAHEAKDCLATISRVAHGLPLGQLAHTLMPDAARLVHTTTTCVLETR